MPVGKKNNFATAITTNLDAKKKEGPLNGNLVHNNKPPNLHRKVLFTRKGSLFTRKGCRRKKFRAICKQMTVYAVCVYS